MVLPYSCCFNSSDRQGSKFVHLNCIAVGKTVFTLQYQNPTYAFRAAGVLVERKVKSLLHLSLFMKQIKNF